MVWIVFSSGLIPFCYFCPYRIPEADANSEHATVAEAKVVVVADHHVVQDSHSHQLAHLFQPPSDLQVLRTGGRVAAWMVMNKDDGGRRFADHRVVHLSRVNQRSCERAF